MSKKDDISNKQWLAIYTKSRSEKKVTNRLLELGYEVYCPVREEIKIWSDRKKKVNVPVFSSYVFVKINEKQRIEILQVPGVVNFVFWLQKPAVIRDVEIQNIKSFLSDYPNADVRSLNVSIGQEIEIKYGKLKDNKGIIEEVRNSTVVIRLDNIGFELIAEVGLRELGQ